MRLRSREVARTPPATSRPTATPSPDEPPACRLLALPAEMKNAIYRLATLRTDAVQVASDGYRRPALLNTCREIRSEALKIWYYESHFHVDLLNYNSDTVFRFCNSVTAFGVDLSKVDYKASIAYQPASWTNLVCWLRRYHVNDVHVSARDPASLLQKGHQDALRHVVAMVFVTVKALRDKHLREIQEVTGYRGLSLDDELRLPSATGFMQQHLVLPLRLWFTEPLVFLVALMAAVSFGFIYLFAEALHVVYHDGFGLGETESSVIFLAIGVGVHFTWIPRLYDVHLARTEVRDGMLFEPEAKLLGYYVAAPLLATGLWWFSATVPPLVHGVSIWASIPSLVLVGYGIVEFDSVLCAYLTDTYTSHAGSANAPVAFLRAVLSGVFPLFAPKKFEALGANNTLFLLAGIATVFCGVAVMFRYYAKTIRERSPFAQKTLGGGAGTKCAAKSRV